MTTVTQTERRRLYSVWYSMRDRCHNASNRHYLNYGGRGIGVCERWNSFDNFVSDMGARPTGYTIERIDNDGDYEPSNCRWETRRRQAINRRRFRNSSSLWLGVDKHRSLFRGAVRVDGKRFKTPAMETAEEAAWMRDQWALALYGDDIPLNFDYV